MNSKYPIARIDYLHTDGSIGESCCFYTESEFLARLKEDNYYGTPMVVNIFRNKNGETIPLDFVEDFDPPPQGFNIIDFSEENDMNEFDKLRKLAERFKSMYPTGTRIELQHMGSDPRPIPDGTRGTVKAVDDIGTIHCEFDNGRSLGIIPGEDKFRVLTIQELLDEKSQKLQSTFFDKINDEILAYIDWNNIRNAYKTGNMDAPAELLKSLHEKFVDVYGTDSLDDDYGFVMVPGVAKGEDGNIYVALLELDISSSGEHWGTVFFTPQGAVDGNENQADAQEILHQIGVYDYWYTPELERDHHVDWSRCPDEVKEMLDYAVGREQTNEVKLE